MRPRARKLSIPGSPLGSQGSGSSADSREQFFRRALADAKASLEALTQLYYYDKAAVWPKESTERDRERVIEEREMAAKALLTQTATAAAAAGAAGVGTGETVGRAL